MNKAINEIRNKPLQALSIVTSFSLEVILTTPITKPILKGKTAAHMPQFRNI